MQITDLKNLTLHTGGERILWIDICKTIAIYFIVISHASYTNTTISDFLFSFHVASFFFISGVLDKSGKMPMTEWVKKQIITLVIPYYLWNFVVLLCGTYTWKYCIAFLLGLVNPNSASWFIKYLILFKLVIYLFESRQLKSILGGCFIIGLILIVDAIRLHNNLDFSVPFSMKVVFACFPFYMGGKLFSQSIVKIGTFVSMHKELAFGGSLFFAFIQFLLFKFLPYTHSSSIAVLAENPILYWITGFNGFFALMFLSSLIAILLKNSNRWIVNISSGTLFIMCTHYELMRFLLSKIQPENDIVILVFCSLYFIVQVYLLPIVLRYCPILAGRKRII